MKLIVGLGNPKEKYQQNRHNVGFMALDYFVTKNEFEPFALNDKFHALISENKIADDKVFLVKPQTFMNNSGHTVQLLKQFYKVKPADILLVYDELALGFGKVRTRSEGSSAGHNGVESVIKAIGDKFDRVRIGIANDDSQQWGAADFVLADFTIEEKPELPKIFDYTSQLIHEFIYIGPLEATTHDCLENLLT